MPFFDDNPAEAEAKHMTEERLGDLCRHVDEWQEDEQASDAEMGEHGSEERSMCAWSKGWSGGVRGT